jgi:hypothetical protein
MTQAETTKDRIRIFDRDGRSLAEFRAAVSRSWALGLEGRANMLLASRKTDYVQRGILEFGNWLLIENDTLPAWVGVIDTPRIWSARTVEVNAYTPERLLSWRRGVSTSQIVAGSAGDIFGFLIDTVNQQEATILQRGDIWTGGIKREETITVAPLDIDLRRIYQRSGEEYEWRPVAEFSGLAVYADWVEKLGEFTQIELSESRKGGNIENPWMYEDGQIINDLFGYGDGLTWASRPQARTVDEDSIAQYGLRQDDKEWEGVKQITTVTNNNATIIAQQKDAQKVFDLIALNVGETFEYMRLGNALRVKLQNIGFDGGTDALVRIIGMSYNPVEGQKIRLVLKEIK